MLFIHLWAGGARRVELEAVHLWVSRYVLGPGRSRPVSGASAVLRQHDHRSLKGIAVFRAVPDHEPKTSPWVRNNFGRGGDRRFGSTSSCVHWGHWDDRVQAVFAGGGLMTGLMTLMEG